MKKYLLLLLFTTIAFAQNPTRFPYGVQITGGQTATSTTSKIISQESNGTLNTIDAANLPTSTDTQDKIDILNQNANSGVLDFDGLAVNVNTTLYDIGAGEGYITNSLTGVVTKVTWPEQLAQSTPYRTSSVATYVLKDDTGTTVMQNTPPSSEMFRTHIYLGKLAHTNFTDILFAVTEPSRMFNTSGDLHDLVSTFGSINKEGNLITPNGANLQINVSAGKTHREGANFLNDRNSPNITSEPAVVATSFRNKFRNGSGGWTAVNTTTVDPNNYDDGSGILQLVPNNKWTVKVVYRFGGTGTIHMDYGQAIYDDLGKADAGIANIVSSDPDTKNYASRIGWILIQQGTTSLLDVTRYKFVPADKIGERSAGTGVPSTLQSSYNNSVTPQILTSIGGGAVTVQEGTGNDANNVLVGKNNVGTTTFSVSGAGKGTVSSLDLSSNPLGSVTNELKQVVGINDYWKIYGKSDTEDRSEMVLELGDNAVPFSANGQRFRFHYNNNAEGVAKSPLIIDYNEIVADANFTAKSIINSTAPATNALLANGTTLANPVSGSLSIGVIPKTTGASTLSNSLITDSGSDVGVNGSFNNLSYTNNQFGVFSMGSNSRTGVEIGSNMSALNTTNGVLAFTSQQSTETNKTLVSIASKTGSNVSSGVMSFSTANAGVLSEKAFLHPSGGFSLGSSTDPGAGTISATTYTGGATLTNAPTAPTAAVGTNTTQIATMAAVQTAVANNGIITTATNITNATLTDNSLPQNGKTILIENGANNITYTVNAGVTASFIKGGTGTITFVQGSGRTLKLCNGTAVFDGAVDSTCSIFSSGTTDRLYINNF